MRCSNFFASALVLLLLVTPAIAAVSEAPSVVDASGALPNAGWWTVVASWLGLDHLWAADAIGPGLDPNGITVPPDDGERGPGLDPNGVTGVPNDGERGPDLDPDGFTATGGEGDCGPDFDPNGACGGL